MGQARITSPLAMSGSDSDAYAQRLKSEGRNIADFGDPQLVAVQGAVVVRDPETDLVLGAIGVSEGRNSPTLAIPNW